MIAKLPPLVSRLLLALLSPLIFLALVEIGLRLSPWDDQLGPQRYHGGLVDHAHFWNPDSMLNLDATVLMPGGEFRGKKIQKAKPKGVFRIVSLGGSFTYGWPYNNKPEVAYPAVMERRLNGDPRVETRVQVLNGGVGGYTSFQGLYYFKKRLRSFAPDLLTICFGANDAQPNDTIGVHLTDRQYYEHLEKMQKRKAMMRVKDLLNSLRTYALVEKMLYQVRAVSSEQTQRVPPDDFRDNLNTFVKMAKTRGFKILLIPEPARAYESLEMQIEISAYARIMDEVARANPGLVSLVDFITPLAGRDKKATFYDEMHLTVPGNQFAGGLLKEAVVKSGYLKK